MLNEQLKQSVGRRNILAGHKMYLLRKQVSDHREHDIPSTFHYEVHGDFHGALGSSIG